MKFEITYFNSLKNKEQTIRLTGINEAKVKENGKLRIEGKEYVMQDGDICYFRFNV